MKIKNTVSKINNLKFFIIKKNVSIELLAHPGRVLEEESSPEYGPDDKIAFVSLTGMLNMKCL